MFFKFRFSLDMVKDDWTPLRYCRPEYHIKCFTFRFSLDMVKDDWLTPRYCRLEYHLKFFKFRFSLDMVKDDWTPPWYCRPETHLKFFLHSDIAWKWWKMIELHPGTADQKLSPQIFYIQIKPGHGERWLTSTQVLQTRISSKMF